MVSNEDTTCYLAAGESKARAQNLVILLLMLGVSSVVIYYCLLLLVKIENNQHTLFALVEIAFVLYVVGATYQAVTRRMVYFLDSTELLIRYGAQGYNIEYKQIKDLRVLARGDLFNSELREGGHSKLCRPYGISNEALLFRHLHHLSYGDIFICATTKADEYLLVSMNEDDVPSLIISAQKFNEFLNDFRVRSLKTPSIV